MLMCVPDLSQVCLIKQFIARVVMVMCVPVTSQVCLIKQLIARVLMLACVPDMSQVCDKAIDSKSGDVAVCT